jgi:hypothetical protein
LTETKAPYERSIGPPVGDGYLFELDDVPQCSQKSSATLGGCHCASACFLIWAAGVERGGSALGLHRPSISSTTFANLAPNRASILYRQLLVDLEKYLSDMEVTRRFIDLMTATTSTDMRWLTHHEADPLEEVPSIAE